MRRTRLMMDNWFFTGPDGYRDVVTLPHTWNAIDGQDGGNDYYRGICIYEKTFRKPDFKEGEVVYIQFHGVNANATVVLNGYEICTHHNGYSTFRVEITEYLKDENHLKVMVDNSKNDKVYPQVADFTFYGGIYRDVELLVVNKYHFDLDYYGGYGMTVSADVNGDEGILNVNTYTNISDTESEEFTIRLKLTDAEGICVAETVGNSAVLIVKDVHLWDGVNDPYLYTLTALLEKNSEILDIISCKTGVRTFSFDRDKGFFLNGKHYPMRGVSRHQDFKGIGNAISYQQMEEDMKIIREMGVTTIRLAHYQHNQYFYDLCDKYGMVVWAEIPYISAHMPAARENTFFQMKELIVQNYNHPCIVTWGISNEITISLKHRADMLDNHRRLNKFVKEFDPTRPTTLACYAMCHPFHPVSKITDIVAWNLYLGWYAPGLFLNDWFMKFYHWKYPERPLGYSEYGAEGMPNLHSARPKRGDHTEEYQAKYHEYMLECFERHPFLWGTYVWNMFDFAADARDQGGEPGMNHKGLVTFDRKIKKDSFYIYKAWWSNEKFVHLCGKRYEYRAEEITDITVYSNHDKVSLYNNGKLVATQTGRYAFHFRLKMEEENHLEVFAGDCKDSGVIYKTDAPLREYKVKKGKSRNWV
ncbi:MAG: glycoside hydrolase family 2 protein [Oscillospiraceae bacterium]|nr:glycoside hydrolase family 2 protein [Oscillospiraceae bacterium]